MGFATLLVVIQIAAALFLLVAGSGTMQKSGKKPLFFTGEETDAGGVQWRPYRLLKYKHPEFVRLAKGHYLTRRPGEIKDPKPFKSKEEKARYELRTGRADLRRFMDEDFWNEWETYAGYDGSASNSGNLQPTNMGGT